MMQPEEEFSTGANGAGPHHSSTHQTSGDNDQDRDNSASGTDIPAHTPRPGGYTRGQPVPSIHDLAMINELGNQSSVFNLAKELITGSKLPEEYLPRGVYDSRTIARRKRIVSRDNRIRRHRGCSLNTSIWVGDQMGIAHNGAGRREAMEVIKASAAIERDERNRRQGFMGIGRPTSS